MPASTPTTSGWYHQRRGDRAEYLDVDDGAPAGFEPGDGGGRVAGGLGEVGLAAATGLTRA